MPEPRTAILGLMPYVYPEDAAAHGVGEQQLSVEQLGELLPAGRAVLLALRDAGWQLTYVSIDDLKSLDANGRQILDVSISFTKDFSPADAQLAIADARACGLSPGWGYPDVAWADHGEDADEDTDENGRWDMTGARID